jgi:hypothetical protein
MGKVSSSAKKHPTGVVTSVAAATVVAAKKFGVDLTAEEAAILVGGIAAIVSWRFPLDSAE